MIRILIAILAAMPVFSSPAAAQGIGEPLVFEGGEPVPLAGAAPAEDALAGDVFLLPFALRNRADEPISLRRIVFRMPDDLAIVDPYIDRIDNDRDGQLDEEDEGFARVDGSTYAWRGDTAGDRIGPGETAERAIRVRILPEARPGAGLTLSIAATASSGDLTVRAARDVPFRLRTPEMAVLLDGRSDGAVLASIDQPKVEAILSIPSGRIEDLVVGLNAATAIGEYRGPHMRIGKGVTCESNSPSAVDGSLIEASFGTCIVDPRAEFADRFVAVEARALLRDADPFAENEVIRAHRAVRVSAMAVSGGEPVSEPGIADGRIAGPLIGARLIEGPEQPADAGDPLQLHYHIANRGDVALSELRLLVDDDGAVDCESLILPGAATPLEACSEGLWLPGGLAPGQSRQIEFGLRLRDDAAFDGPIAVQLRAVGPGRLSWSLPPAPYSLRPPPAPSLALEPGGSWRETDGLLTARVGDVAALRLEGEFIEGNYPAVLRLRARLVNAQTGVPVAAAPLSVERFRIIRAPGLARKHWDPQIDTEDGWTLVAVPIAAVSVPASSADRDRAFVATAHVSLRDDAEVRSGRLLEITAELELNGDTAAGGDSWIEALIVEPSMEVTVVSPDPDRVIEIAGSAEVAVLACNRGTAEAMALVISAEIPQGLTLADPENTRMVGVRSGSAADPEAVIAAGPEAVIGSAEYDAGSAILRGVLAGRGALAARECAALIFTLRRVAVLAAERPEAALTARLEPFTSGAGPRGRIYPGGETGTITFSLPPVRLGPPSERRIGEQRLIAHDAALEVPSGAGAYRIRLSTESTAGLDWTILRVEDDGTMTPWRDGTELHPGDVVDLRFEARNPGDVPLGWVDTTLVRALAFAADNPPVAARTRLVTRKRRTPGGAVTVRKMLALDRDCDGDVGDERAQDALFEPVKDAAVGDCVVFRVAFRHSGDKTMERIVVRDRVPPGTALRPDAVEILRAPEPLQNAEVVPPKAGERDMVWMFDGLFAPGTEGEVGYTVRLVGEGAADAPRAE